MQLLRSLHVYAISEVNAYTPVLVLIGETLIPSDQTRFLSVIIDINLDFKLHIMQILDKIS